MKYKLGIYGSSAGDIKAVTPRAIELGKALSAYSDKLILVTGACQGLPYIVAAEAAKGGVEIWGYAAEFDIEGLRAVAPNDDQTIYSKLVYIPRDFPLASYGRARMKYRNVISTANCDAGIIVSGRWGTLNEFTNLIDFQKSIGVLTSTGGIADELPALTRKIVKEGQGKIVFDNDPVALVKKVLGLLETA